MDEGQPLADLAEPAPPRLTSDDELLPGRRGRAPEKAAPNPKAATRGAATRTRPKVKAATKVATATPKPAAKPTAKQKPRPGARPRRPRAAKAATRGAAPGPGQAESRGREMARPRRSRPPSRPQAAATKTGRQAEKPDVRSRRNTTAHAQGHRDTLGRAQDLAAPESQDHHKAQGRPERSSVDLTPGAAAQVMRRSTGQARLLIDLTARSPSVDHPTLAAIDVRLPDVNRRPVVVDYGP